MTDKLEDHLRRDLTALAGQAPRAPEYANLRHRLRRDFRRRVVLAISSLAVAVVGWAALVPMPISHAVIAYKAPLPPHRPIIHSLSGVPQPSYHDGDLFTLAETIDRRLRAAHVVSAELSKDKNDNISCLVVGSDDPHLIADLRILMRKAHILHFRFSGGRNQLAAII